jgi:hypothetical protein
MRFRRRIYRAIRRAACVFAYCTAAVLATGDAGAQPQLADFVTLAPVSDGSASTNDNGWANVEINATAFKNQSTVTVGNYQFISYYAADQTLILGRRNLVTSPDTWFLLRTGETSANINDSHNVSTIGIDGDGFLHAAWGVHGNPLRYMRTDQSVLSDASFTVPGNTSGQTPLQSGSITYPEFWNVPGSGDMLLSYRTGSSGNGEYQLARWNNGTNVWDSVHAVSGSGNANTGPQPWIDNDFSSAEAPPNANAYLNGLVYDSTGRLHTTWTWRTGGDSTSGFTDFQSNHNLMYAYSDNHGVDWRLADGSLLQRNGVHDIDENNATPVISLPEGSSLINQASSTVGPDDTLYTATWWAPDAAQGNHTRQYMLAAYNPYEPMPQWQTYQVGERAAENGNNHVPESQLGTFRMSRPIVLTDDDNRVLVVFSDHQRGQGVTVAYSELPTRDDWQYLDLTTNEDLNLWEPKYDQARWESDGVLSMLYQPAGQGLSPTPVSIIEWDAKAYFQELGGN